MFERSGQSYAADGSTGGWGGTTPADDHVTLAAMAAPKNFPTIAATISTPVIHHIAELRPAALDELGLDAAIETLTERSAAAAGRAVETRIDLNGDGAARLTRETETIVYRVVQEALSNAAQHSGGSLVRVEVAEREDLVDVTVSDNGHGFDPAAATAGFGLRGMREWVQLAGGWMTIDSSGEGSVVRARLPAHS